MNALTAGLGSACERILIRGVNWLGDAVMTTPAIQRLREACPDSHISLLTHEKLRDLWEAHPHIDRVETFASGEGVGSIARRLKSGNHDLGVTFPNSPRTALELWRADIPLRVGYRASWRRWLLTDAVSRSGEVVHMRKRSEAEIRRLIDGSGADAAPAIPAASHHIHHYLRLVAAIGASPEPVAPLIEVPEGAVAEFREAFLPESVSVARWLGLNPGAEYGPAKRWPARRFIEAAVRMSREVGCGWIVFGAKGDRETEAIAAEIAAQCATGQVLCLVGRTTLAQLCAGLRVCDAVLTNDSGPMHVAAALGTPVVVPFGSTSIELTGPGLPGDSTHRLLSAEAPCAPCFLRECPVDFRCMEGISVERVVGALNEVLAD